MKAFKITGKIPRYKPRAGVRPTKKETTKKSYTRKAKHKNETHWTKGND
jgi:hypothetical protein